MTKSSSKRRDKRAGKPRTVIVTSRPIAVMSVSPDLRKEPFFAPPIPDALCVWAGKVAFAWSYVELQLDQLIMGLINVTKDEPKQRVDRMSFAKRKELCKEQAKIVFANEPGVVEALSKILGDAADLHWQRNFLLHGRLTARAIAPPNQLPREGFMPSLQLSAAGRHNGKNTTLSFGDRDVERLFHKIGHLAGRFGYFVNGDVQLPSDEKLKLAQFLSANLPSPPILEKLPPQRQS